MAVLSLFRSILLKHAKFFSASQAMQLVVVVIPKVFREFELTWWIYIMNLYGIYIQVSSFYYVF